MVFGIVFCFRKIFGEILQKLGEISSQPSGNTENTTNTITTNTIRSLENICEEKYEVYQFWLIVF